MLNSGIRTSKSFSLGFAFLFAGAAALAQTAEPAAQAASAAVAAAAMNPYGKLLFIFLLDESIMK